MNKRIETHTQACKRAMQSLYSLLWEIEAHPEKATELAAKRHIFAEPAGPQGAGAEPLALHLIVTPLDLVMTRADCMALGMSWYLEDYSSHCDASMPDVVRKRLAETLETAGILEEDSPKGEAGCRTTGKIRSHSERVLPQRGGSPEIRWPPVALAALVRERGLVIEPAVLALFGIEPSGRRPSIVPSSHA